MPRTKIEEHAFYPFSVQLEVRVSDLNYGAHLGYDRLLGLAQEARMKMLAELDASEMDLGDGKTGMVVADVAIVYLGEAFHGDALTFDIRPVEVGRGSFRLAHRVVRQNGAKVALIEIGVAAFDYSARRPVQLPEKLRARLLEMSQPQESST